MSCERNRHRLLTQILEAGGAGRYDGEIQVPEARRQIQGDFDARNERHPGREPLEPLLGSQAQAGLDESKIVLVCGLRLTTESFTNGAVGGSCVLGHRVSVLPRRPRPPGLWRITLPP